MTKQTRDEVIEAQIKIERKLSEMPSGLASAVFIVPQPLTPLFVSSSKKSNFFQEASVPDGLVSKEQLPEILRRTETLDDMLKKGIPITVFYVDDRKKISGSEKVDNRHLQLRLCQYQNLKLARISKDLYEKHKNNVAAATYFYAENHQKKYCAVQAAQANQSVNSIEPRFLEGESVGSCIRALEEFIEEEKNLASMQQSHRSKL